MPLDPELMRSLDESNTLMGQIAGRAYCTMLASAVKEGMPEDLARQLVGPFVVKQILSSFDRVPLPDPEKGFLDWLRGQMDNEE